jgi:hypothetical protein
MRRCAVRLVPSGRAVGALLLMAHPRRLPALPANVADEPRAAATGAMNRRPLAGDARQRTEVAVPPLGPLLLFAGFAPDAGKPGGWSRPGLALRANARLSPAAHPQRSAHLRPVIL